MGRHVREQWWDAADLSRVVEAVSAALSIEIIIGVREHPTGACCAYHCITRVLRCIVSIYLAMRPCS